MTETVFRAAAPSDLRFLRAVLAEALNWRSDPRFDRSVLNRPEATHYLDGWQRESDFGVVAERSGEPAGATWARLLTADDPGYGYVADEIPELTLAVAPGHRGFGLGSRLLEHLVERARELGAPGLSLSVEDGNEVRRLYQRLGFEVVGREGNSDTMVLTFW